MAEMSSALTRVRTTRGADLLPDSEIVQLLDSLGIVWRERLLTPVVMVRLFLVQVLFGNTSITHLRQLSGIDFAPASYCQARMRLPLQLLRRLLRWTIAAANAQGKRSIGPRVMLKCQTIGGVQRELMMYLIAYNLIRLAMLQFAQTRGQSVDRVSFVDAMRYLAMRMLG